MAPLSHRTPTIFAALFVGLSGLACAGLPIGDTADIQLPADEGDSEPAGDEEEEAPSEDEEPSEQAEPEDGDEDGTDEDGGGEEDGADDGEAAPAPKPAPAPAPEPEPTGAQVNFKGDGKAVLVSSGGRFPIPGNVPPGSYEIEVTFGSAAPVRTGKVTVGEGGTTIRCKESMGLCRAQ